MADSKARTLFDKVWDAHVVEQLPDGTCVLYIDRHLVHEVTSPQAFEGLRGRCRGGVERQRRVLGGLQRGDQSGDADGNQERRDLGLGLLCLDGLERRGDRRVVDRGRGERNLGQPGIVERTDLRGRVEHLERIPLHRAPDLLRLEIGPLVAGL